jgi:hypothetical protein
MKRTIAMLAAVVVTVGVIQLVLAAGPGVAGTAAATTTDITFKEGYCSSPGASCKSIDAGGGAAGYGSSLVFTIPLSASGKKIGIEQGVCTNLQKKSQLNFCHYNLHFKGGWISVQGTLPLNSDTSRSIPITGGTGDYEGATGWLKIIKGSSFRYTVHIVTP